MSKKRNSYLLLKDIFDAIETIEEYLRGLEEDAFAKTKDKIAHQ